MSTEAAFAAPAPPRTTAARLRWAITDGWTLTRRDLAHWAARPGQATITLLFPIMMVLLFGYLLGGGMKVPGGDYREFLLPGMFALTMAFGMETTFTAVTTDISRGVTDRFRSMPMAGSAVVTGRATADMLAAALSLAAMLACGLAVGWQPHRGPTNTLAAVGLLLLLRFALLWAAIYLALLAGNPEAVAALQILVWPVGFLSNAFTAPDTMPDWLGAAAEWNPLSATVAAARELFGNPGWGSGSWAAGHSILLATVWPLILTAVFFPLSVRRYRGLSR